MANPKAATSTTKKKTPTPDFGDTYARLRALLKPYDKKLDVRTDRGTVYESWCHGKLNGREMLFAGVIVRKRYVSFHLFPVYSHPELLEGMSAELSKRMQGKSCFNFTRLDKVHEREIRGLVKSGFDCYKKLGLV